MEDGLILKEEYLRAKKRAQHEVYIAKKNAETNKFANVKADPRNVFKIAKQMKKEGKDVVGEACVKDNTGKLCFTPEMKKKAWKEYYEHLLNVEFSWAKDQLPNVEPVVGAAPEITQDETSKAINSMKNGKAPGPSGVVSEMLKASMDASSDVIARLANAYSRRYNSI